MNIKTTENSLLFRVLRKPVYHCRDIRRVNESPYPYRVCPVTNWTQPSCWVLTPLGILHRWIGLTLEVPEP